MASADARAASCGRLAEALEVYTRAREMIASELGTDPGPELQRLYQRILACDTATAEQAPGATPTATAAHRLAVRCPPPATCGGAHFTGRREELRTLDGLLSGVPGTAGTVVISAIDGTAGVGKTTLALHWAHRVAGRFPDGQLYVNLRGFGPAGAPVDPAEAIRGFLDAPRGAAGTGPAGLDAQAALYRSLLAGKRMLIVAGQRPRRRTGTPAAARPAPDAWSSVTSRSQLDGLIAARRRTSSPSTCSPRRGPRTAGPPARHRPGRRPSRKRPPS